MSLTHKYENRSSACCQFKAVSSSFIVFELLRNDLEGIRRDLTETIRHASQFFSESPVIIDIEKIKSYGSIDFVQLKNLLVSQRIIPIGIRGGNQQQQEEAIQVGLPTIRTSKPVTQEPAKNIATIKLPAKIINQPIRSGMQVYAKESDLIITAQVSSGAEIMADGHIHVYGALRGKAIAGMHGNLEARIFCQLLEADLIAIAGHYLTRDEMILPKDKNSPVQIYLKNEKIQIETM